MKTNNPFLFSIFVYSLERMHSLSVRKINFPRMSTTFQPVRVLRNSNSNIYRSRHFSNIKMVAVENAADEKVMFNRQEIDSNSKYFEFEKVEDKIYTWWESSGHFKPSSNRLKKPYVIPMPPPNVTGYLHMGHAMFVALQDIMARFQRMRGRATLWLPGTDHAGIATQLLVERALVAEGTSRAALGREEFLKRVWSWKEEKGGYITSQMRRLGASADWSRERFTLEPLLSEAVTEAFVTLHERGLVYKGDYMVNWSPNLQTAVSDLEVEYSEEMGKLYYFKYMLSDSASAGEEAEFIPVATTRPETILGDSAVCVHPSDERYKRYIGKTVLVPILGRKIPGRGAHEQLESYTCSLVCPPWILCRVEVMCPGHLTQVYVINVLSDCGRVRGYGVWHRSAQDNASPRP